ncbi:sulfotransferase [Roseixanthobacter glucoisosaccharinicivorans]|uniref:sulfotransferase n=1 Tax=Roseixanthobacter glucoisosaccharinicivorans TaxID=3119923 RepID=UPI00372BD4D7
MPDILLTGMPRSGTTLVVALLGRQPDTIALAEPIQLNPHGDRHRAVDEIAEFVVQTRAAAIANKPIPTKHVDGYIIDNWVEPPRQDGHLRKVLEQRSELLFDKPLSDNFTLIVKHPAEFTALADLLVKRFTLYAIVRDPMAVMAAWQTVNMPVNRGHMPMAEAFAPELKRRLAGIKDRLVGQATLIEWQLRTYLTLPAGRVLRYEDITAEPSSALECFGTSGLMLPSLAAYDPVERYTGVDFHALYRALEPLLGLIVQFYPNFEQEWASRLG